MMMYQGYRPAKVLVAAASLATLGAGTPTSAITVELQGMRNERGVLRMCLTKAAAHFPDCEGDADAVKLSVDASMRLVSLPAVSPGAYALSVIHDENGNGKLDTTLGIPREGFGFSRNPAIGFGPPAFARVRFVAEAGESREMVKLRYLL